MNLGVVKQESPPHCFGEQWDKNEPACAGGPDTSFVPQAGERYDGKDERGVNVRRQCDWYQSCGARFAARKNAQGQLVPPHQLIRPPAEPAPSPAAPRTFGQWLQQVNNQVVARPPAQQVQVPTQQQQQVHVPVMPNAQVHAAPYWQLNYTMPAYLSTPEIRHPGESMWAVLLREILRGMAKALGHSVAHFFDSRPMKE